MARVVADSGRAYGPCGLHDLAGPNVLGTIEAGLQVYQTHAWEVKADYTLSAGNSFLSQSIGLRGAWHF